MKKNCRNCKWAAWRRTESGRRLFGNFAECTYQVDLKLPASRYEAEKVLKRKVGVWDYRDIEMECPTWEREEKKAKP